MEKVEMGSRSVLIYGGKGALGAALVNYFKNKAFWIASVDFVQNDEANLNVVLQQNLSLEEQVRVLLFPVHFLFLLC